MQSLKLFIKLYYVFNDMSTGLSKLSKDTRFCNRCCYDKRYFIRLIFFGNSFYISSLAQANITFKHHMHEVQTSHKKEERLFATLPFLHMVRMKGLEPPRRGHKILSLTRLPVSPHPLLARNFAFCFEEYPCLDKKVNS